MLLVEESADERGTRRAVTPKVRECLLTHPRAPNLIASLQEATVKIVHGFPSTDDLKHMHNN